MVAAASPPPAPAPHATPDRGHPTYTKMITHALTELGGCSERPGITDYIHDCFSGLPPSHDGLLNAHLRRLVAEGVLRTDGADSPSYTFAPPSPAGEKPPSAEKRGPGRPRKDTGASTPVATPLGEKRGRGRPRKSPQGSSEKPAHTGIATPWLFATTQEASEPIQAGGEARNFQNGGDATPVQSGGASSAGMKRGPGRPRKEKPSVAAAAAAISPEPSTTPSSTPGSKRGRGRPRKEKPSEAALYRTGRGAALRGFKRGCGRPTMDRAAAAAAFSAETSMEKLAAAAAAMYAETGDTASAGGGQSKMEKLAAAAVAAMSAEGTKRGRGRPRKVKPPSAAVAAMFAEGTKRGRGRPRKVKPPSVSAYEAFFRDMMAEDNTRRRRREEEEDSVSGEKTQTEEGVAPGKGKETRDADAGRVPVSGENAASASVDATDPDLGPVNFADDATSTGIKRPRGRPRKYPAAADAGMSTGVKRRRVRPREKPVEVTSAPETGDAVSTGVKRGRGRPRKYPGAASTDVKKVKRGRGRPWKRRNTIGTGFVEAGGEVLFRNVTEAPGDPVSGKKTQTEDAAPVYRKETRVAGAGHVPVSGENAKICQIKSGCVGCSV